MQSVTDYVSMHHILSEASKTVNDEDFRNGFSQGWFISRIQDALQELAFDTYFQIITADYDFPKERLAMEMPKNCFNIREIYLYNGGCCSPETSAVVYWKRLYNNNGKGAGYTARVKRSGEGNSTDPYQPTWYNEGYWATRGRLYFANIQNGLIMFGSESASFSKVRLVYNGMGGEIGDEPIIPRFFERAINDYVEEKYYNAMKSRDSRNYRALWSDAYMKLEKSWRKAENRIKMMSTFEKASMDEYISGIYHK
jgi:hypothetical protein